MLDFYSIILNTRGELKPVEGHTLKAWCDLYQQEFSPFEIDALRAIDIAFLSKAIEQQKKNRPAN